jgi:hypothetical protein
MCLLPKGKTKNTNIKMNMTHSMVRSTTLLFKWLFKMCYASFNVKTWSNVLVTFGQRQNTTNKTILHSRDLRKDFHTKKTFLRPFQTTNPKPDHFLVSINFKYIILCYCFVFINKSRAVLLEQILVLIINSPDRSA